MTRHTRRALLGAGALLVTGTLALSGCGGGSGFDDGGDAGRRGRRAHLVRRRAHDPHRLERRRGDGCRQGGGRRMVRGVGRRGRGEGRRPTRPRSCRRDLRRETRPTSSTSPRRSSPGYAGNGSLMPYGELLENADDFYPSLVENFTFEDEFYCAPKDFSTPGPRHQQGTVGCRGPDRRRHPDHVGRAGNGRPDPHEGRRRRPRVRMGVAAHRHLHGAGRRRSRRGRRGDRQQPGERGRPDLRQGPDGRPARSRTRRTSAPAGAARRSASSSPR